MTMVVCAWEPEVIIFISLCSAGQHCNRPNPRQLFVGLEITGTRGSLIPGFSFLPCQSPGSTVLWFQKVEIGTGGSLIPKIVFCPTKAEEGLWFENIFITGFFGVVASPPWVGATLVRTCNWFDPVVQNSWERREPPGAFLLLVSQILSFCGLPLFSHLLMDTTNGNAAEDEDDEDKRRRRRQDRARDDAACWSQRRRTCPPTTVLS